MVVRGPGRFVAPLALIASVFGVMVVVLISHVDAPPVSSLRHPTDSAPRHAKPRLRSYVVKPGDNLTVIAEKTGVSIETIERLNPDADPQALAAGARLKLTP